ncbi:hypothetical protein Trydic_g22081 [Trypoxylus dichotomus]
MDYTVPYTPQLNGKAERLNRTLAERIRSLLIDSELEKNMWGEAAFVATYLLNRSPTAGMNDDEKQKIIFASDVVFKETRNTDTPRKEIVLRWPINDAHYEENKIESETLDENSIEQDQENDENLIQDNEEKSQEVEKPMQSKRSDRTKKLPKYLEEYELDVENISSIEEEKKFLIENNTWEKVDRQEAGGAKILNNKWVLRIKNDGLVLCGNQQEYGIDFTETYSPVVDVSCLRIILPVAAARNYTIFGFDIKTVFLYRKLEETIFMNIPKGYPHADKICKLKKSLYGLKQISLKWNELFTSFLRNNGLKALETQRCIFKNDNGTLILVIYVDDGILIGNNVIQMNELLSRLEYEFKMKIDKNLKTFVGIEIDKMEDGLMLKQENYIKNVLEKHRMRDSKPVETPIAGITKIADDEHDELRFPYREVVGSLLYAFCKTRPDLAYAVNYESRFVENPKKLDVTNVKRTLRYLNGSTSGGIKYTLLVVKIQNEVHTSGYVIMFCGGPIAWFSRRQSIVSLSSTEAEFIAAAECTKELMYLKCLISREPSVKTVSEVQMSNVKEITKPKARHLGHSSKISESSIDSIPTLSGEEFLPTNKEEMDTYDEVLPSTSAGEQQQQQHSGDNNAKPPALCFVSRMKERFHEFKQMLNTISTNYYVQFASDNTTRSTRYLCSRYLNPSHSNTYPPIASKIPAKHEGVPGAPKKGIIQCKKCQALGHATANCFLKVMRCVECIEEHRSFMCKKPPSTTPLQPLRTRKGYFSSLFHAKTRVAPLKTISLPRLANLARKAANALEISYNERSFWTDSTITLAWIKSDPSRWKTFVANRVSEIQNLSDSTEWHHVRPEDNPADLLSRGVSPRFIGEENLWWHGPRWLTLCKSAWNRGNTEAIDNIRTGKERELLPEELDYSLSMLVRAVQIECFKGEYNCLVAGKDLDSKSTILNLNPFLHNGVIRVGGRLQNCKLSFENKHQLILPKRHALTDLILRHEHKRLMHCGAQNLVYNVREKFWPLSARNSCKRIVRSCIKCFKAKPSDTNYLMGNLPKFRVNEPTFTNVGVDYGGPFSIKDSKGRGAKVSKCYLCLFVCMCSKAIHLELVSELSTPAFIATLTRFVSRRGKPSNIYSDNGLNFIGANNELQKIYDFLESEQNIIKNKLVNERINWYFIPARSPTFRGTWEAGIKSTKFHLKRVVGNAILTFEELCTVLTEIEGILNSRPLCPFSNDPNDLVAITPGHFSIPENRLTSYQRLQAIRQHFWVRWSKEYLTELQTGVKWKKNNKHLLQVGSLVPLKNENQPSQNWQLGRVAKLYLGGDRVCRVVDIQVQRGILKRAVNKVCILPIEH